MTAPGRAIRPGAWGIAGWMLALVVVGTFLRLGTWQLARMHEKEALLAEAARVGDTTVPLATALRQRLHLARVDGRGRFLPGTVLLDNQLREGQAGVKAYRVFQPESSPSLVLVDLGWQELPGNRAMPPVDVPAGTVHVSGLLAPFPSTGIAMGGGEVPAPGRPGTLLATRVDPAVLGPALGLPSTPYPSALRLDPALPFGYARDLDLLPNTLPPSRHLGYAVQWFALALAVLVTALVVTLRRRRPRRAALPLDPPA